MNLYAYVGNEPINLEDPLGLEGALTIATDAGGTYGQHSWIEYRHFNSDGSITLKTYSTYTNSNGPQGIEGVNTGDGAFTQYDTTSSRATHLSDADEATLANEIAFQQTKGSSIWSAGHTCAGFASDVWFHLTGEYLSDFQDSVLPSTPVGLNGSIINANGGTNHGALKKH